MGGTGRILAIGGHDFNRRSGNDALCDLIVELAQSSRPRICLLPTASGDPEDQIASFRRAFGERGCRPSAISLFRLGTEPVDLRRQLLAQDVIYIGGGSMVNLLAIWRAHGLDELLRECLGEGILICGQSAGAMCWFEQGLTCSSGTPEFAAGLGELAGSASVHYLAEPERRSRFLRGIGDRSIPAGLGLDDQAAALFEHGRLIETVTAREGASIWDVRPVEGAAAGGVLAQERPLGSRRIRDQRPAIDALRPEIIEFRQTLAARAVARRLRRGRVGRLD
ncbi:MAG: peptidase E [Actinomycetota bacterium]|nr:peptidase E [Actinomycetota bacterium]